MIDNFECEKAVIRQFVIIHLQKCLEDATMDNIVRLPYQIVKFCQQIFKRQQIVNSYLFELLKNVIYLTDLEVINQVAEDFVNDLYRRVLVKCQNKVVMFLGQIHVRIVMLGLSVRLNMKDKEFFGKKLKGFVRKLQFELEFVLASSESLSDLILKQLKEIKQIFNDLEFIETIRNSFMRMQVVRVIRWADNELQTKRQKCFQKNESIIPFKLENNKTQDKKDFKSTKKRQSIRQKEFDAKEIQKSIEKNKIEKIQENEGIKQQVKNEKRQRQKRLSRISEANKTRLSGHVSYTRYSTKFTFKSTKKSQMKEIVEFCEVTPPQEQSKKKDHSVKKRFKSTPQEIQQSDESSKFGYPATPPPRRSNRRKTEF